MPLPAMGLKRWNWPERSTNFPGVMTLRVKRHSRRPGPRRDSSRKQSHSRGAHYKWLPVRKIQNGLRHFRCSSNRMRRVSRIEREAQPHKESATDHHIAHSNDMFVPSAENDYAWRATWDDTLHY